MSFFLVVTDDALEIASLPLPVTLRKYFVQCAAETVTRNYFRWDGALLCWIGEGKEQLVVDFASPKLLWRFSKLNKAQEPLLRAMGWKNGVTRSVWDLTAGLGRDSVLLAYAGFEVTMFERNAVIQLLLASALYVLQEEQASLANRIQLVTQDAIELLPQAVSVGNLPDILYLDPMYPHRKKSALVKLELRMVRSLVGDDNDSATLLNLALSTGVARVVVKRPAKAEYLGGLKPHHMIEAPNTRYDIYGS